MPQDICVNGVTPHTQILILWTDNLSLASQELTANNDKLLSVVGGNLVCVRINVTSNNQYQHLRPIPNFKFTSSYELNNILQSNIDVLTRSYNEIIELHSNDETIELHYETTSRDSLTQNGTMINSHIQSDA